MFRALAVSAFLAQAGAWSSSVHAATAHCTKSNAYDAATKASVISLLKARYGNAYKAFDIDHPAFVDMYVGRRSTEVVETARGRMQVDRRRVSWLNFERARSANTPAAVPISIIVAFDMCSGKAVGFQIE